MEDHKSRITEGRSAQSLQSLEVQSRFESPIRGGHMVVDLEVRRASTLGERSEIFFGRKDL